MKKILPALSIGLTSIAALSNNAHAEKAARPIAFNDPKTFRLSIRHMAAIENLSSMSNYVPAENDVHSKAMRDFRTRFSNIDNALWFSEENGYVSYFVRDGYGNRVFYDKKGRWQFSLIVYGEYQLPSEVRASVKSIYFDLAITQVEEVQTNSGMLYIVNLEDKSNIKVLKVSSKGEIDVLLELSKD